MEDSSNKQIRFKYLGLKFKLQIAFFLVALLSILSIGLLGFFSAQQALEKVTFAQLTSVRETKRRAIENYFSQMRKQIITLSEDDMVIKAMRGFNNASFFFKEDMQDFQLESMRSNLRDFYLNDFAPRWKSNSSDSVAINSLFVNTPKTIDLQYHYMSNNPFQTGFKSLYNIAEDGSIYSDIHARYHPILRNYADEFEYYDIFLINSETGDILYSVEKEIDFMTSLINGPYRRTNFARAFRKARDARMSSFVALEDFEQYIPSYDSPAAFLASPIYDGEDKIGVLAFQIPIDKINSIMTGERQWESDGLGSTGETYLVGSDFKLRSDARLLIEDEEHYLSTLSDKITEAGKDAIAKHKTSILFHELRTEASEEVLRGEIDNRISENYRGTQSLSAYSLLDIDDVQWAIISEIEEQEAFLPIYKLRRGILTTMFVLFIISFIVGAWYANTFVKPILNLKDALVKLSKGELSDKIKVSSQDEVGQTSEAMNDFIDQMDLAASFAKDIGNGEYDTSFKPVSENDRLGNALAQMRDQLKKIAEEDRKRNWATEGIAKFADILRDHGQNIDDLADNILPNLIRYLDVTQGAFYVIEQESSKEPFLCLKAAFAYNRKKYLSQKIQKNQGITGQSWQDKDTIYMDDVPEDYVTIRSGLGGAHPTAILAVPLKINEQIHGVIELASLDKIAPHKIKFVETISESIASTISIIYSNRTKQNK